VRENGTREIVDEEHNTCRCRPENLERIVSNKETLIELLGHCIKERGVSGRQGVEICYVSNSPIAIDRGSKGDR